MGRKENSEENRKHSPEKRAGKTRQVGNHGTANRRQKADKKESIGEKVQGKKTDIARAGIALDRVSNPVLMMEKLIKARQNSSCRST